MVMTPDEKKAFVARMKAAREAKAKTRKSKPKKSKRKPKKVFSERQLISMRRKQKGSPKKMQNKVMARLQKLKVRAQNGG
jgi:hypothetical protein